MQGTVTRWNNNRGFGFIRPEDADMNHSTSEDTFAHISALPEGVEYLTPGTRVSYSLSTDIRGRTKAVCVRPVAWEDDDDSGA